MSEDPQENPKLRWNKNIKMNEWYSFIFNA